MAGALLKNIAAAAVQFRAAVADRWVGASAGRLQLLTAIDKNLPNQGEPPETALRKLISGAEPGLVHNVNPRYFGFVIRSLPAPRPAT